MQWRRTGQEFILKKTISLNNYSIFITYRYLHFFVLSFCNFLRPPCVALLYLKNFIQLMIVSILFLPVALQLESTRVRRKKSTTECPQLGTKNSFYRKVVQPYQDKQEVSSI